MKYLLPTVLLLLFHIFTPPVKAIYDPFATPNNKVGIHILTEEDIPEAANLVNSQGGDWGYVTLVIREDERDYGRWKTFFHNLKTSRLIPIVRLATTTKGSNWKIPEKSAPEEWADFLNKLDWPTQNRYVLIYNEPNHAKEWGGEINPAEYAQTLNNFISVLKWKNDDFFALPAGLDLAAPNSLDTQNSLTYMREMEKEIPGIFSRLDGWTSHSYPNPGFSGSPNDTGKMSIRGYEWELSTLKNEFGVEKTLPVFITETGWAKSDKLSPETIAKYYQTAFSDVWNNHQIAAITPFLLRYDDEPFSPFSFIIPKAEAAYYPQYDVIQQLEKVSAHPLGTNKTPLGKQIDDIILRRNN
jgi:hypothetical protein